MNKNINKQELQNKLNEMLVGKSAYSMYKLGDYVKDHINELGIDNAQGEWRTNINAYTISLVYKTYIVASFDIKREKHEKFNWAVKQVVVEDNFIDLKTRLEQIHNFYKRDIERHNEWNFYSSSLGDLKELLTLIKNANKGKTKLELRELISDLSRDYWLVDELLESEK